MSSDSLEAAVEGMSVAMVTGSQIADREKLDPLGGEGALPEPMLVTASPKCQSRRQLISPANRPTMALCPGT